LDAEGGCSFPDVVVGGSVVKADVVCPAVPEAIDLA
jgi:hypothetical protein